MANALAIELASMLARSASGMGAPLQISSLRSAALITIRCVDMTGVPSDLALTIETSDDGSIWRKAYQAPLRVGASRIALGDLGQYLRASWAFVSVTTAATFQVDGEAHQLFADKTDLLCGELPPEALGVLKDDVTIRALISASTDAEDALAAAGLLPITSWPQSLTQRVTAIAAFLIMKRRGFQPQGTDELIVKGHDDAQSWLKMVSAGKIRPPGLVPAVRFGPQAPSVDTHRVVVPVSSDSAGDDWSGFG